MIPIANSSAYRAAQEGAAWLDRSGREQLRVIGGDRVSFVQGMVSNDVETLGIGGSLYTTMLFVLEVANRGHLAQVMRSLRRLQDVVKIAKMRE